MRADDLLSAIRKRPFDQFRIQISDGTTYDVRHPELIMVGLGAALIGIPPADQDKPVFDRYETVALSHMVKLLPLDRQTAGTGASN